MKRVLLGVLSAAAVLPICMAAAFAAGPGGGRYFADANGDGICDNAGSCACAYVDADGDGVCDTCGAAHAQAGGRNFVDADGDGVCDRYASGQGCGYGRGIHGGCGNGPRGGRGR